ncbi:Aste57867_10347 [Aphanomyces stellatus]|uniref:Phospholipid-transporting ATPase n=1 Tax=Aphanomyces stellatus TaxID=120398 RepID=A0A485KQ40_9STRA|nr:hypothetical protein As57867_010307 [Aphanomyces stellatus]VFT87221.1 Aste57867_10347 [Aphanomyces stellatus]
MNSTDPPPPPPPMDLIREAAATTPVVEDLSQDIQASYVEMQDVPSPGSTTAASPPIAATVPTDHYIAVDESTMSAPGQWSDILHSPRANAQPDTMEKLLKETKTTGPTSNAIRTSHYTWWNFVPVFLYYTFRKMANFYFLMIGFLQMIPPISPTNGVPLQFLPLAIVVLIDAVFAAIEDSTRHRADEVTNNSPCMRYNMTTCAFEAATWKDITVGDLVQLKDNEVAPADIVVLATDGQMAVAGFGVCYIETKSLDGEANLKLREALLQSRFEVPESQFGAAMRGLKFENDPPSADIHNHHGAAHCFTNEEVTTIPIGANHTVWRGCKIRNTKRVWGVVAYAGVDTKIMQGMTERDMKMSTIDAVTYATSSDASDSQVVVIVIMLIALCIIGAAAYTIWSSPMLPSYLDNSVNNPFITSFFYFLITMAAILPITLYVSVTTVKALQGYFMTQDLEMYDAERGMHMQARNKALNEQLGHITHIFSDKTGTITCNKMEFRKCSIRGISYGTGTTAIGRAAARALSQSSSSGQIQSGTDDGTAAVLPQVVVDDEVDRSPALPCKKKRKSVANVNFCDDQLFDDMGGARGVEQEAAIRHFFKHLALCHSVLIDSKDMFVASSPDELALVSGAKFFGYEFLERNPGAMLIETPSGARESYEILEVFEFTSHRKRMSVAFKQKDHVLFLCKGADTKVFPRLKPDAWVTETQRQLEAYATEGLRTLVIGSKSVPLDEWEAFYKEYQRVMVANPDDVDRLQDEMEQGLTLLGVTAIEDRLQDQVPETIQLLAKAGIGLWVLTGDMEETAINIGYACSLLTNTMERYVINAKTCPTRICLLHHLDEIYSRMIYSAFGGQDLAIVIDGASLTLILDDEADNIDALHFLRVALLCRVVIACRCSPSQKAQLVDLVQKNCDDARTLAIGDGANDVPMICAAHVGIGIAGEEGRQAVNSSDFAIGQFRFLSRLLLVHGRWNYNRIAHLILFTYYKNIVYCMSMYWYMLSYSAYSGALLYPVFIQQGYNLFFTSLPIIAFAVLDQDVPAEVAMAIPQLYNLTGRKLFKNNRFWKWIVMGVVDSLILLYLLTFSSAIIETNGGTASLLNLGDLGWTVLCLYMNIRLMMFVSTWNIFLILSIVLMLAFTYGFEIAIDYLNMQSPVYDSSFPWMFGQGNVWLVQLLICAALASKDLIYAAYQRTFHPTVLDLAQMATTNPPKAGTASMAHPSLDSLESIEFPYVKWILPHLHNLPNNEETDTSPNAVPQEAMRQSGYRGFAFDEPVHAIRWLMTRKNSTVPKPNHSRWNTEFLQFILSTADPVVYENERYQPFLGFGHTFPGHLLPSDRGHWSNASGIVSTNKAISTDLLRVDMAFPGADKDGWVYASDFSRFPTTTCSRTFAFVRRRRWVLRDGATLDLDDNPM